MTPEQMKKYGRSLGLWRNNAKVGAKPKLQYGLPPSAYSKKVVDETQPQTIKERLAAQRAANLKESEKPVTPIPEKRFAKSSLVPKDSCEVGCEKESLLDIFKGAALFALPAENTAIPIVDEVGTFLTQTAGKVIPELENYAIRMSMTAVDAVASVSVGAIASAGVLMAYSPYAGEPNEPYTYEGTELYSLSSVKTNVRLGVSSTGIAWGYHVNGSYIDTKRVNKVGDKFVVHLDGEVTLEWVPIIDLEDGHNILVNPIPDTDEEIKIYIHPEHEQGTEQDGRYITPIHQGDFRDCILTFPPETGIPPIYIVYTSPRDLPGTVTGQGQNIGGTWLAGAGDGKGVPIPTSVADKLRGKKFNNFNQLRGEIWFEVQNDPILRAQFNGGNQATMANKRAPFCRKGDRVGGRVKYELHHNEYVKNGGDVYNLDNLTVVTVKNHIRIHKEEK